MKLTINMRMMILNGIDKLKAQEFADFLFAYAKEPNQHLGELRIKS